VREDQGGGPEAGGDADEVEQNRGDRDQGAAEHDQQQQERDHHDRHDGEGRRSDESVGEVGVLRARTTEAGAGDFGGETAAQPGHQ